MIKVGLIAGLANLILGFVLNWLTGFMLPGIYREYQNTAVFRPWNDPLMLLYFAYPFILGVILAYLWGLLKENFKGDLLKKAFNFAKIYLILATIPGMFITYTSMQISLPMVLWWAFTGFLQVFVAGLIFARLKY